MNRDPIVRLDESRTQCKLTDDEWHDAVAAASRINMSPHEWSWTIHEQKLMAKFCQWASQRLDAINQLSSDTPLTHQYSGSQLDAAYERGYREGVNRTQKELS